MARGVSKRTIPFSIDSASTKLVYCIYLLVVTFDGFICSFPGAIYVQLQTSLNTSVVVVSWIYTALSIGYIISNLVCGFLADHITESHRLHSAILFACGIAVICVPFTTNILFVFILFAIIGVGMASNETHFTLFVFRLYPTDGVKMFFLGIVIFNICAVISALFIQFSISMTGTYLYPFVIFGGIAIAIPLQEALRLIARYSSYLYPFVIFGGIAIVHSIAILFFETPKHDEYRAIKRRASTLQKDATTTEEVMEDDKLAEAASTKLKQSKNYQKLQNVTIMLLMLSMSLHAAQMGGFLSFTTVYCRDYLHIDEKFGRYFISSFWGGSLITIILRQLLAPNSSPVLAVVISNILRCILQVLFIPLSKMTNPSIAFLVMYALCGATTSLYVPALCSWAELIRSTTGMIACLWWVLYGIGNAAMMLSMGELIEQYGAKWIPFIICVPLFVAAVVNTIAVVTYKIIRKQESTAFEEIKHAPNETDIDTEGETDTETVPPLA
eukprot:CAMPEP_0197073104 /NCGR_PEP_ID=MMETSP1384-20130603/210435_1 /TAXON_ID=29189 /ORGANISM="Ammonia sp." /LENGTH=498 /DNA_ID=CAMNT_0042511931 /DNA_START=44 /DNA_END=1541 /DNA_ORIENTATION=-